MALTTREARQSASGLLLWFLPPGVDPSSLDMAGRHAAAHSYSGILSGALKIAVMMASYFRRRALE